MRTSVVAATLSVGLLGVASAVGIAPASAAPSDSVRVSLRTPAPVVITSGSCKDVPIVYDFATTGTVQRIAVESEVWKGDQYLSSTYAFVYPTEGGTQLEASVSNCGTIGTFRVGPTTGEWNNAEYDTLSVSNPGSVYYTARQGSRFKNTKIVRKGKVRTFYAKSQYFDSGLQRWSNVPKGTKLSLERRTSSGSWRFVKTSRAGSKGAVKIAIKTSKKADYRVTIKGTVRTWGTSSKVIRK